MGIQDAVGIALEVPRDSLNPALQQTVGLLRQVESNTRGAGSVTTSVAGAQRRSWQEVAAILTTVQRVYSGTMVVIQQIRQATQEYVDEANSLRQLSFAVEQHGVSWEAAGVEIESFIDQAAEAGGVLDDVARQAFAQFAQTTAGLELTVDQLERGTALVLDVAAASGRSAPEIARSLAKIYSGQTEAIGELLPAQRAHIQELVRTRGATAAAEEAVRLLEEAYGGARLEIDGGVEAIGRLDRVLDLAKETIGEVAGRLLDVEGGLVNIQARIWSGALGDLQDDMLDLEEDMDPLDQRIRQLTANLQELADLGVAETSVVFSQQRVELEQLRATLAPLTAEYVALREEQADLIERRAALLEEPAPLAPEGPAGAGGGPPDGRGGADAAAREREALEREKWSTTEAALQAHTDRMTDIWAEYGQRLADQFMLQAQLEDARTAKIHEMAVLEEAARLALIEQRTEAADKALMIADAEGLAAKAARDEGFAAVEAGIQGVAGFASGTAGQAYLLGILEEAKAIAALAELNIPGFIAHQFAAIQAFTVRDKARASGGRGGGGGGGARAIPSAPAFSGRRDLGHEEQRQAPVHITLYAPDEYAMGIATGRRLNRAAEYDSGLRLRQELTRRPRL